MRHGQTVANQEGRFSGWSDVPLTAQGEAEARALAPVLSGHTFEGVWSSDLGRALATARMAWGEPRPDARLRELHFGALEGQRWADIDPVLRQSLLDFEGFCAPGGESLADFEDRVHGFLRTLPPGRHLLFTHGGVVRLLTRGLGVDRFLPNGVVVALDWHCPSAALRQGGQPAAPGVSTREVTPFPGVRMPAGRSWPPGRHDFGTNDRWESERRERAVEPTASQPRA